MHPSYLHQRGAIRPPGLRGQVEQQGVNLHLDILPTILD